jgi:hypothetical protein
VQIKFNFNMTPTTGQHADTFNYTHRLNMRFSPTFHYNFFISWCSEEKLSKSEKISRKQNLKFRIYFDVDLLKFGSFPNNNNCMKPNQLLFGAS